MIKIFYFAVILLFCIFLGILIYGYLKRKGILDQIQSKIEVFEYEKPQIKYLTIEQIERIHSQGKLTPAEKVEEWESQDLCAPGDAIGTASDRCKKYHHNCHDCLVDYANQSIEYTSTYDEFKIVNNI